MTSTHSIGNPLSRKEIMVVKLLLKVTKPTEGNPLHDRPRCLQPLVDTVKEVVAQYYTTTLPYGVVCDEETNVHKLLIYFPTIVKDMDPIYRMVIHDLVKTLNHTNLLTQGIYGEVKWSEMNVTFEDSPEPVDGFEDDMCDECEHVSEEMIRVARKMGVTSNIMALLVDRFDMLLEHFLSIHRTDKNFFVENIRYVCCAFYRQRKLTSYSERDEVSVTVDDWLRVSRLFGVDDALAARYYNQIDDYSYTVVTMEEVLRRRGPEMRERINRYNSDRIRYMVKKLILQSHVPSHNELWRVFAEFLRRDHFYADGHVYVCDDNRCIRREAKDLRPVANRFVNYLREGMLTLKVEALQRGETLDTKKTEARIAEMIKPFENSSSVKFIENACSNYLDSRIRTAIRRVAIPFKDVVVVYDQSKLVWRKAFMEDQFTSTTPVKALGFGHLESHKRAIKEVKDTLMKMFNNRANVDWFIKWLGSLPTHQPERVCLIIHGPKGRNGKTTFMKVLCFILGDCATQCRPDILIANSKGGTSCTPFEMELKDKVLAVISEPLRAQIYSSSTLKDATGGDPKTGARKYMDPETFEQTAKVVILSNHIPTFDEPDLPLCDRLYVIHSSGRFVKNAHPDPDVQAAQEMYQEDMDFWNDERKQALAHIMLHEGFPAYIRDGLSKTPAQVEALKKWQSGTDPYMSFAQLTKDTHNREAYVTDAVQVYDVYKQKNRNASSLSYEKFKADFADSTGHRVMKIGDTEYYCFYHPACDTRFKAREMTSDDHDEDDGNGTDAE